MLVLRGWDRRTSAARLVVALVGQVQLSLEVVHVVVTSLVVILVSFSTIPTGPAPALTDFVSVALAECVPVVVLLPSASAAA